MTLFRQACARLAAGVCFLLLGGCAAMLPQTAALQDAKPAQLPDRIELERVPFVPQDDNLCGPAALKMALNAAERDAALGDLKEQVFLPGRKGSLQAEMLAAPRRYGLVGYQLAPRFEDVLREISAGLPVIVLQDYGVWPAPIWHYAVVIGYDHPRSEVILHTGLKPAMRMPFGVFEYLWKQSGYWAMVAAPPDQLPATADEARYVEAIAALERTGDARNARLAYARFLARWPGNEKAAIGFANSLHALGDLREAEDALRAALVRHPDSPVLLNNLAQTLSDLNRNEEALALAERAASLGGPFAAAVADTRREIAERLARQRH